MSFKTEGVFIIGAGGHAVSVLESILASGVVINGFVDANKQSTQIAGYDVFSTLPTIEVPNLIVALGDNYVRQRQVQILKRQYTNAVFPSIIHPSASVSSLAEIGEGSVVLQGAIVGCQARVGRFCIMNSGSGIDHDTSVGDFSSFAPFSHCGGNVRIGESSAIGIGASLKHGISVGNNVVVGAKSYVHKDLPSDGVFYGCPARYIRSRQQSDKYL